MCAARKGFKDKGHIGRHIHISKGMTQNKGRGMQCTLLGKVTKDTLDLHLNATRTATCLQRHCAFIAQLGK